MRRLRQDERLRQYSRQIAHVKGPKGSWLVNPSLAGIDGLGFLILKMGTVIAPTLQDSGDQ